jgi:hypothetical protein
VTDPNAILMATIRAKYGAAITAACSGTNLPPAFLAALIANESGGNADAKRFEPAVLVSLWQVLQGRKANFGAIGGRDLLAFIQSPIVGVGNPVTAACQRLDSLATSYGLTQIMGYNVFGILEPVNLAAPAASLQQTLRMLEDFAGHYALNLDTDFNEMFRCWNTGNPTGTTADPDYVNNGHLRMGFYGATSPPPEAA